MKKLLYAAAFGLALVQAPALNAQSQKAPSELSVDAFQAAIDAGKARLVDVRTPAEYAAGHIVGSINIDWTANDYEEQFAKLDKKVPVLLYCHGGGRSEQALEHLTAQGYQAQHLAGGFVAWKKAGKSSVK